MARKPDGPGWVGEFARKVRFFPASNRIHVHLIGYSHAALAHKPLAIGIPVGGGFERRARRGSGVSLERSHKQFLVGNLKSQGGMGIHATIQPLRLFASTTKEHHAMSWSAPPHDHVRRSCQNVFWEDLWRISRPQAVRQ